MAVSVEMLWRCQLADLMDGESSVLRHAIHNRCMDDRLSAFPGLEPGSGGTGYPETANGSGFPNWPESGNCGSPVRRCAASRDADSAHNWSQALRSPANAEWLPHSSIEDNAFWRRTLAITVLAVPAAVVIFIGASINGGTMEWFLRGLSK